MLFPIIGRSGVIIIPTAAPSSADRYTHTLLSGLSVLMGLPEFVNISDFWRSYNHFLSSDRQNVPWDTKLSMVNM